MLTVDFINSLGITAQGLKVVNGNNTILSANIAGETPNSVQIGGFTVGANSLESGTSGTSNYVKLGTDEIKLGTAFSVDKAGAIKSTSGTIGNLKVTSSGLIYDGSQSSYFEIGSESSDSRMPTHAIFAKTQRIDNCIMGFKSDSYNANSWVEFKPDGYYVYKSSDLTSAEIAGKIPYNYLNKICWLNSLLGSAHYGDSATCPQIIVFEDKVASGKVQTYDLSAYGINEIIGAQLTERDSSANTYNP